MPSHIAMFSIPAHGHVNPSLEVIRELVARGHRVTYAIPAEFADTVAETGAEPRLYTSVLPTGDEEWGEEHIDQVEPFLADAIQALPQHAAAYEGDEPDLVLYDIGCGQARLLASRWGVPAVQISPCMVAWDGYDEMMAPALAALKSDPRGVAYYERYAAFLKENGVDKDPDHWGAHPRRSIALITRAMQPNPEQVDLATYSFTGPCQGSRADQGEWQRPAGARKVLLVSLGSAFTNEPGFYRACVEAFRGLDDWHVVLQIGKFTDEAAIGEIPANFEVHRWVPQLAILKQADAFITHAGMGGSQEGLATATPMVAVPQAADQFMNADLIEGLGVGRHLPKEDVTAEKLRELVLALVSDPEVAAKAETIKREMLEEGGTKRAADLIESELGA